MSAIGCYYFLLVLALGDCMLLENLFVPVPQRKTVTRSFKASPMSKPTPLPDRYYWLDKLRENVFKTISPEPPLNMEIYYAIHKAPYYGGPAPCTMFGDIVTLAAGYLKRDLKGEWIFCEDRCTNCSICSDVATAKQLQWTVKRIRHHDKEKTFRYDLQFNINPVTEIERGGHARSRSHVYHSVKDSQPPSTKPRKEDYLLDADDYDVQEFNELRDDRYRKFAEFYKPGFIVKVDTRGERHVVHDVPFLTEAPVSPSFTERYPDIQHHHHPPGNVDFSQTYPDYYNALYNEVLQALMANRNLWRGLTMHHRKRERCSGDKSSASQDPGVAIRKNVSMQRRVIEFPNSRIERVKPAANDIDMEWNPNHSMTTSPNLLLSNWKFVPTIHRVGDWTLMPNIQKQSNMRNAEAMPSGVMEMMVSRNSMQNQSPEKGTNHSERPMENPEKETAKMDDSLGNNSKYGNLSHVVPEELKLNDSEITQSTTLETIILEDYSMDTPIMNLSARAEENINGTEIPVSIVTEETGNTTVEAKLLISNYMLDGFPEVTDKDTNSMNKSDTVTELKLYKTLLKQLALSVISQQDVFEGNSTLEENVEITTETTLVKRSEQKITKHRRSHRDGEVPAEKSFMTLW